MQLVQPATPGVSGVSPGVYGVSPGLSGASPGESGASPGGSGAAPGKSAATPGVSGARTATSEISRDTSCLPCHRVTPLLPSWPLFQLYSTVRCTLSPRSRFSKGRVPHPRCVPPPCAAPSYPQWARCPATSSGQASTSPWQSSRPLRGELQRGLHSTYPPLCVTPCAGVS